MNQIALVLGTSVATAAIVSAIFLFAGPDPSTTAVEPSEDHTGRVVVLEKKLAAMERRLGAVEVASARAGTPPAGGTAGPHADAVAKLRDGDKAAEDVVLGVLDSGDPDVANKVQAAVRDQLDIAREERFQERIKLRQQRISERVDKLADDNALPTATRKKLNELLVGEHAARMQLMRDARENMRWEDAREKMEASRDATDKEVEALLDADALEDYKAWRGQTEWGPGRGGRRQGGDAPDTGSRRP